MYKNELTPLVLGLHRIGYPPKSASIRGLFTSLKLLRFEISFLRSIGYRFTTLTDAFVFPQPRTAVLTFDDGYRDNLLAADSVLNELEVPATVFVITSDIGKTGVTWDEAGEKLPSDMLSWDDLRSLKARGWEIGSHSHLHVHHDRRTYFEQKALIAASLNAIEANIGIRPVTFAYPYGVYNSDTLRALRHLGIRYAVTTRPWWPEPPESGQRNYLELPRIPLGGRHLIHYIRAMNLTLRTAARETAVYPSTQAGFGAIISLFSRLRFSANDKIVP